MTTLYTFGYLKKSSSRTLKELSFLQVPLVDIRYKPYSYTHPQWRKEYLEHLSGITYYWVPELGNELYREALSGTFQEPQIKLHSPEEGIRKMEEILQKHRHAAIFCACATPTSCHRSVVAHLLLEKVPDLKIKIVHI